jgi:hypothetical protein
MTTDKATIDERVENCSKTVTGKHIWQDYSRIMFESTGRSMGGNPKERCIACGLFDDRKWEAYAYGSWQEKFMALFKKKFEKVRGL